ncbi:hypothetical protein LAT59_00600 [Candidatus Gracilibacteria bacterium]|nr:hypothetical protein [Candidatus Gracilibacteria bacterium]
MSINTQRDEMNASLESGDKKQGNIENLETKVYNLYVERGIHEQGVSFVNHIMSLPDSDTSYQDDVMAFINGKTEFDTLGEDFRGKMSLGKIKARVAPEYARYKSRRVEMKKLVQKHFDISEEQYVRHIEPKVKLLSQEKLQDYTRSSEMLKKFFQDEGIQEPQRKNIKGFLESLNIDSKLGSFSSDKKQELEYLLNEAIHSTPVNSPLFGQRVNNLIHRLLAEGVFDSMQKKELILAFLPTISLSKIQSLGLMSEAEIDGYIQREFISDISSSHKQEALRQIKNKAQDIEIPTTSLTLNSTSILDTLTENSNFDRFIHEIQDFHRITNSKEITDFDTLIDMISSELSEKIIGIENFTRGNILALYAKNGSQDEIQYHEIVSTQSENPPHDRIVFRNRGGNGVYNTSSEKLEYQSYSDFHKLISDPKLIGKAEFISKNIFEEKLDTGELSQVEGEYNFEVTNIGENFNTDRLKQAIDILDANGKKYSLGVGTTFKTDGTLANGGDDLYTITHIDESKLPGGEIQLINIGGKGEKIDFETFFETWKGKKTKRVAKVTSGEELIADINTEKSVWSQTKYESGKLMDESYPKGSQEVEFLVSDTKLSLGDDTNLIKIHSISGTSAKISFGKYEGKVIPNSLKGKKGKGANYSVSKDVVEVSLGMLANWTKEADLKPKNIKGENIPEKLPESAKIGGSLGSYYLNNFANIASLVAAGKTWGDNMKNYFEEGTNEQAMRLASKLPVFSDEQKSAMKMRLEQSEKKHTDEALEKLKVLDSAPATELVAKWLTNKYSTESRKVASLLYMLEKYGVLYEKDAMMAYKGTFLFYKAFGGEVGDELYMQYKDECERATPPKQFLEEDLMYKLISLRCKGKIKPPLRGRLYKEVEAIMGKGLTDELEKGKKDAEKKGTFAEKEQFAFGELESGGYPNAMGAFEAMVGKGNTPQRLNKLPFVMLTSGAAKSFSAQLTNKFKLGNLVLTTFFTHSSAHTDLFNRVVVSLSHDIAQKLGGRYSDMGKKADKLINGMKGKTETERIHAAKEFYESEDGLYEDILGRSLLMMNTQKADKITEFETWLRDHSDTNPDYKEYCSLLDVAFEMGADKFFGEQEELLTDAFHIADKDHGGMTGMDTKAFVKKFIVPQSGGVGFRNVKMGNKVWKEIINKIDYLTQSDVDISYKRHRIGKLLADLMDGISPTYAQNPRELNGVLTNPASVFYTRFNSWGVQSSDFALGGETFEESKKGQQVINRYIDNILAGSSVGTEANTYSMKNITNRVQSGVADNLNQNPYNSYDNIV